MGYEKVLDRFGSVIEEDLRRTFDQLKEEGARYHPFIGDVYEAIEEFVMRGGRRLAACGTLVAYKGYSGRIDDEIVKISSGVELFRHAILVHDDIVDRELLRRGGKTLHRTLGGQGESLGMGSALFAGNILYALAIEAVSGSGFDAPVVTEIEDLLSSEYRAVNESQILDLLFEFKETDLDEWTVMASRRAASLFRASIMAGAIPASAPKDDIALLEEAGRKIGIAFDIQDDIIDTFATKEQYGRDPCGDISKGKKPLHVVVALQRDDRLSSFIKGERELSDEEVDEVQEIIRSSGALDEAKAISSAHAREAERLISRTRMGEAEKEFFISFIRYVDESLEWYK
ncbi:MAG: polyprenyl synthetase family protein [Methanotrichaceae archaeon]|nr:polyprenyl synthetase family protein [Methanotrichaceae archaeon]